MKVIGKIFAVIFCIIYYFALTGLLLSAFVSNTLSGNYYADIFTNIDLKTIKASDLGEFFNEGQFDEDASLEDVIIEYFAAGNVEEEKIQALLNDKEARNKAGKVIGEIVSYAMGGEKPQISREEIKSFFDNPVVTDVTGNPTEENIDYLYNQINKAIEEVEGGINVGDNTKRNTNTVEVIR